MMEMVSVKGGDEFRRLVGLQFFAEDGGAGADAEEGAEAGAFEAGLFGDDAEEPIEEAGGGAEPDEPDTQPETEETPDSAADQVDGGTPTTTIPVTLGSGTAQIDAAAVQALARSLGMTPQAAVETLQKGMNYEHKAARELSVLGEYAKAAGMTTEEYVDALDKQKGEMQLTQEMQRVAGEMPEGTPEDAIRRVAEANLAQRQTQERQQAAQARESAERQEYERMKTGWSALFAERPELGKPGAVPKEVFELCGKLHCTPGEGFARHEAQQLRAQLAEAQTKLAAAQKNNQNRQAAVGSMESAGAVTEDAFLSGLQSDGY